jgi:Abnormal spindle-like microcephaly-assoc'd, ASPM-SPD-2-Hydin
MAIPAVAQASLQFSPNVPTPVAFGSTTVMNSSEQTLTLTNTSTTASENISGVSITGPEGNQFGIGPYNCPPTLGPGASCNFNVRFNPSHSGNIAAQLQVNNNPNPPLTRPLTGTGVPANLTPSASTIDFGTVLIEDNGEPGSIVVQNTGSASTQISQVDVTGPDASAFRPEGTCTGPSLSPGQSCPVSVRFEPHQTGTQNATLHIRAGGSDFPVALTGFGGVAEIALSPNLLDFGNVAVGSSATKSFTAHSIGNSPFQAFVAVVSGGDVGDMRVVEDLCSLRLLAPTQQCTISVRFTPSAAGPADAALAVIGEDAANIGRLRGNGVAGPPAPPARRKARVVFRRKPGPARIKHGRVKLGQARCKGTPSCTATVRTRFVVKVPGARRPYLVQGSTQKWNLPRKRPVSIRVPKGIRGTISRVIVTVRASAPGYDASKQRKVLRLKPAKAPNTPRPPA